METLGSAAQAPAPSPLAAAPAIPTPSPERVTERQVEAVYAVMRLLRNDHPKAAENDTIRCDRCQRERPSHGSVQYGARLLCNGCATDYELLRVSRSVGEIEDFFRRP